MTETATANNPTEASASAAAASTGSSTGTATEASATLLAAANGGTGENQQTQTTQTPAATATETAKTEPTKTEAAAAPVVPEKYEFKAPEGTAYDPQIVESFSAAAQEAALTQDAAQKLIEKMAPALAARQADQVKAMHQEWQTASSSDKEFGGEKLKENLAVAKKALDAFDPLPASADGKPVTTPLRTLLETSGLGNHPEILRLLFRAGKAISEDTFVGGAPGGKSAAKPENVLYDKTTQKG